MSKGKRRRGEERIKAEMKAGRKIKEKRKKKEGKGRINGSEEFRTHHFIVIQKTLFHYICTR